MKKTLGTEPSNAPETEVETVGTPTQVFTPPVYTPRPKTL